MKTTSFRVKDLMINVIPELAREGGGGGSAGLIGPDQDITDFSPITPVISVAIQLNSLQTLQKGGLQRLSLEGFNAAAVDVGRAALGSMFLCSQDMPTCEANQVISPVATVADSLRFEDLMIAKEVLTETLEQINHLEAGRLEQARSEAKEIAPLLEDALSVLTER